MNIDELKNELAIRCKNGLPFLLSATVIWSIVLVIFLLPYKIEGKNILTLYSTSIMFPLSILCSKIIRADWRANDNPLGMLGLYLNLAQLMYFPILAFTFYKNPNQMIIFFAVITGAHLFPYGWYYNAKAYMVMAPVMSILIIVIGWNVDISRLWLIPLSMIGLLVILNIWIFVEYKVKIQFSNQNIAKSS
ncbi:DUF7010 family protein [Clostridium sp.]